MIKSAKKCEARKEYSEADDIYHDALLHLHEYSRDGHADELQVSQARAYLFDSMADMALREGKLNKAEALYKSVISELLVKQNFPKDDNALIEISLKLAMIYAEQERNDVAAMGYDYCMQTLENKLGISKDGEEKNDKGELKKDTIDETTVRKNLEKGVVDTNTLTLYGITLDSFANFLYSLQKIPQALALFQKALEVSQQVLGGSHPQVAVIHNSMGVIHAGMKHHGEAIGHFERAVQVAEKSESPDLCVYLFNLAEVKQDIGLSEEALVYYKRAHIAASQHPGQKNALDKINKALEKLNVKDK